MRGKLMLRLLAPVVAFLLVSGGIAFAHTIEHPTTLTIDFENGEFIGRLFSEHRPCMRHQVVNLILVGQGKQDVDVTNRHGLYDFNLEQDAEGRFRVRYRGTILDATHPHLHTCAPSVSDTFSL